MKNLIFNSRPVFFLAFLPLFFAVNSGDCHAANKDQQKKAPQRNLPKRPQGKDGPNIPAAQKQPTNHRKLPYIAAEAKEQFLIIRDILVEIAEDYGHQPLETADKCQKGIKISADFKTNKNAIFGVFFDESQGAQAYPLQVFIKGSAEYNKKIGEKSLNMLIDLTDKESSLEFDKNTMDSFLDQIIASIRAQGPDIIPSKEELILNLVSFIEDMLDIKRTFSKRVLSREETAKEKNESMIAASSLLFLLYGFYQKAQSSNLTNVIMDNLLLSSGFKKQELDNINEKNKSTPDKAMIIKKNLLKKLFAQKNAAKLDQFVEKMSTTIRVIEIPCKTQEEAETIIKSVNKTLNDAINNIMEKAKNGQLNRMTAAEYINMIRSGDIAIVHPMIADKYKSAKTLNIKSDNMGEHGITQYNKFVESKSEMVFSFYSFTNLQNNTTGHYVYILCPKNPINQLLRLDRFGVYSSKYSSWLLNNEEKEIARLQLVEGIVQGLIMSGVELSKQEGSPTSAFYSQKYSFVLANKKNVEISGEEIRKAFMLQPHLRNWLQLMNQAAADQAKKRSGMGEDQQGMGTPDANPNEEEDNAPAYEF